jgi:hypothetical protein
MPKKGEFDPVKERYWRRQLAAFEASGMTGEEFCRQRGLTRASLSNWRKRLAQRDEWRGENEQGSGRSDFARVLLDRPGAVVDDDRPGTDMQMEVVLGNGVVLRIADQCSMNLLASVPSIVGEG